MGYPRIELNEEVMREGMQIESVNISVEEKIELLDALSHTGLNSIMVGSFVSQRYTPQMARVDEIVRGFTPVDGVNYRALALNLKGRERAAAYGDRLSASRLGAVTLAHLCDTFIRRNANMSQREEMSFWPKIVEAAQQTQSEGTIGIGAAWGSNFTGPRSLADRQAILRAAHAVWTNAGFPVTAVSFADPMSWCMPDAVEETLLWLIGEWPEITTVHLHLHDARGMALVSFYAALKVLDERHTIILDTTLGGIGGCPYCGNGRATGMAATEDVVHMLAALGIETGVDLDALIRAEWMLERIIGRSTPGRVSKAGPTPRTIASVYDPNLPLVETFEEARHFAVGTQAVEHQMSPWREPIPPADTSRLTTTESGATA